MASMEHNAETAEILLLQAQAGLAGVSIVHQDEDAVANKDRIVVKADAREPEVIGRSPADVRVWKVPVSVMIHLWTKSKATLDAYKTAIDTANNSTPAAGTLTAIVALFPAPQRVDIDSVSGGEHENSENVRTREIMLAFLISA